MQGLEKIIDLLKTGGWQAFFVSIALFAFILLEARGMIDTTPVPYIVPVVWLIAIVFAGISAAAFGDYLKGLNAVRKKEAARKKAELARRQAFIEDIPRLSDREKRIFGYLLAKNRKRFEADSTGDHASSLIAKGYIVLIARPGMHYHFSSFPFEVADFVWEEISNRRDQFPYEPVTSTRGGRHEVPPWVARDW